MFTLLVNAKKFDEQVWQHESEFTQEQYNKWLKGAIENLQLIYATYDVSGVVGEDCGDVYVLGDIINTLSATQIKLDRNLEVKSKRTK